jgi:hypothetical protein
MKFNDRAQPGTRNGRATRVGTRRSRREAIEMVEQQAAGRADLCSHRTPLRHALQRAFDSALAGTPRSQSPRLMRLISGCTRAGNRCRLPFSVR